MLDIYTDGGCRDNPGPGAWAFVVVNNGVAELTGRMGFADTTNNIMELTAILKAIEWLNENKPGQPFTVYSDSQYAINTINEWYDKWVREGSLRKRKNLALIESIMALKTPAMTFRWLRGHAGNQFNEMADRLVNQTMDEMGVPPARFYH